MTIGLTVGMGIWGTDKYLSQNKKLNDKTIAMYIQNEEGTYTASTETQFPTDGYVLNTEKSNCRNGGTITQDINTKKVNFVTSKADSCTLYFDKHNPSADTLARLGATSKGTKDSFAIAATTDEGIFEMEDDYGTSYYFRGAVENNYVKFGKNQSERDMYWRIIRINGDGSLRIIYDGTKAWANGVSNTNRLVLTNQVWNKNYNDSKYVGYMYGGANGEASTSKEQAQTNETSSNIKIALEAWYKKNIEDTGYGNAISDEIFCNDKSIPGKTATGWSSDTGLGYGKNYTGYEAYARLGAESSGPNNNNPQPSFKCPEKNDAFTKEDIEKGNGMLEYPVGMITADEIVAVGSGKYVTVNQNYYLYKGSSYWSLSPNRYSSYATMFGVYENGSLRSNYVQIINSVAPVINLSAEYVNTMIGSGTATDPYRTA